MIKEFIGTGSTVEAATNAAKIGLNAPALADIKIEVVAMPKKKVLGLFGGADAKVRASYDDGKKEQSQKKPAPKSTPKTKKPAPKKEKPAPVAKTEPKKRETVPVAEIPANFDAEPVKKYLAEIIKGLKVDDAVIETAIVDSTVNIEIKCSDYGIIIGHRGETLDSIQYLINLFVRKLTDRSIRVAINVGNYREKRVETLKNLAKKNASYVSRSGRRYTFEPMNPYERRIIHTTVQEIEGVESKSVGYNQDRRVVLEPTGGVRNNSRGNSNYRPRNQRSDNSKAVQNETPKADRADLPKFSKIEVNKD